MASALAQQIQLALECIALEAVAGGDEQLLDVRRSGACTVAQVGAVHIGRHLSPADQGLPFLGADRRDNGFAALALGSVGWQEHDTRGKLARRR